MTDLDGAWVTLATPFSATGELDQGVLAEQVAFLRDQGIRRLVPGGNTGEYFSLNPSEVLACVKTTRRAAPHDVVVAGIGGELEAASRLAGEAMAAGADGIMIHHPVHPYVGHQGLAAYYRRILACVEGRAMLYKRSHLLPDDLLVELLRNGEAWGVKYGVNDLTAFTTAVAAAPQAVWLCGTAELWAPFFALAGSRGFTSGIGNAGPQITLAMEAALRQRDFQRAMEIRELARPFEEIRAEDAAAKNVPAVRTAIKLAGFDVGDPRPPLAPLSEPDVSRVRNIWSSWAESGFVQADGPAAADRDASQRTGGRVRSRRGGRILVVDPTSPGLLNNEEANRLRRFLRPGTHLEVMALREGPKSIQTAADEALAARGVADLLGREASGYDAAVVGCTLDVGVDDARVAIPVLGPGRVAMRIAASLGGPFSVAVAEPAGVEEMRRLAHSYGLGQQLASVRTLGIPIAKLAEDLPYTAQAIANAARSAARLDGASCLVIGSTVASPAVELAAELLADEHQAAKLIDPASCALLCAEALAIGITTGLPQPRSLPSAAVAS